MCEVKENEPTQGHKNLCDPIDAEVLRRDFFAHGLGSCVKAI